ncbi:MAG TPA: AMP-binding protein, partial [Burkholderiales bacterium]|nr:AMP-binding protein [Burkholderiales bacterium]
MAIKVRQVRLGPTDVVVERRRDGVVLLKSPHELSSYPEAITHKLDYWASAAPDRVFLAQREGGGAWEKFTYAEVREGARRVAQALIDRKLSAERPVVVLSGNDIEHALIELGCLYAGIPYVPVSPSYSLLSTDYSKLKHIVDLVTPG